MLERFKLLNIRVRLIRVEEKYREMEESSGGGEPPDKKLCEILQEAKGVNCGIPPSTIITSKPPQTNKRTNEPHKNYITDGINDFTPDFDENIWTQTQTQTQTPYNPIQKPKHQRKTIGLVAGTSAQTS